MHQKRYIKQEENQTKLAQMETDHLSNMLTFGRLRKHDCWIIHCGLSMQKVKK